MKKISILLLLVAMAISCSAERLHGIVINQKGKPVKKVRVYCPSTKESVYTGVDGEFAFSDAAALDTLVVYADKKKEARFPVSSAEKITIKIDKNNFYVDNGKENSQYDYIIKKMSRRATNVITREQIEESNAESIYDLLRGRLAGVLVTNGDNGPTVVVRGANSFLMNNEPIFVVDGMVYGNSSDVDNGVSVKSIEKVEVVKEGLDYGARGANGAIIITTTRGARSKK